MASTEAGAPLTSSATGRAYRGVSAKDTHASAQRFSVPENEVVASRIRERWRSPCERGGSRRRSRRGGRRDGPHLARSFLPRRPRPEGEPVPHLSSGGGRSRCWWSLR